MFPHGVTKHQRRCTLARQKLVNSIHFLNMYYGPTAGEVLIKLRRGAALMLRSRSCGGVGDPDIADEVVLDDIYQIERAVLPGDIVLDIGAHIGCFSVLAASLGARKVIALEPELTNFERLQLNASLNPTLPIVAMRFAVWPDFACQLSLHPSNNGGHQISPAHPMEPVNQPTQRCPIMSPGELFSVIRNQGVSVLKVDCEGAEEHILCSKDGLASIDRIVFETHDGVGNYSRRDSIFCHLAGLGYDITPIACRSDSEGNFSVSLARRTVT